MEVSRVNKNFPFLLVLFYVVAILIMEIIFMFTVYPNKRVEIQIKNIQNPQSSAFNGNSNSSDDGFREPGDPMEELQRITQRCDEKISGFIQIADQAKANWQTCMDSINPDFFTSESTNKITEMEENHDESITDPSLITSEMKICFNTTAYKSCWSSVIAALNECVEGIGDVAGAILFALFDDNCRDGGRLTKETLRKVGEEGCFRNYSTPECEKNKLLWNSNDVCLRFNSRTACDISSIDPNCSNEEDKVFHANTFGRVGQQLQCDSKRNTGSGVIEIYTEKVQGEAQVEGSSDTDTVTIVVAGSAAVIILIIIGFCISLLYLRKKFAVNKPGNDIELQEVNV